MASDAEKEVLKYLREGWTVTLSYCGGAILAKSSSKNQGFGDTAQTAVEDLLRAMKETEKLFREERAEFIQEQKRLFEGNC